MFYAAINRYATETSVGFANTWGVLGFANRVMRDAYVQRAKDMATKAIASKEIGKYDGKRGKINYYAASGDLMVYIIDGFVCSGLKIDPVTAKRILSSEEKAAGAYWDER